MKTKSSLNVSWVIDLSVLKRNTMINSMQFSDCMRNVVPTINKTNPFDGFNLLIYVIRESNGHMDHTDLGPDITFSDHCKL